MPVDGRYIPDPVRDEDVPDTVLRVTLVPDERLFDIYLSGPLPFSGRVTEDEDARVTLRPPLATSERVTLRPPLAVSERVTDSTPPERVTAFRSIPT